MKDMGQERFNAMGNEERSKLIICLQDGGVPTAKARIFAMQAASIKFMVEDVGLTYEQAIDTLSQQLDRYRAKAKSLGKP